jgi:hypothetical protein
LDKSSEQESGEATAALAARLCTLADQWSVARSRVNAAGQAVARDKAMRRAAGLVARAVDAITETPPEAELVAAQAALEALRAPTVGVVRSWLIERTAQLLHADTSIPPWSAQQALRHLHLTDLLPRLREWHRLAGDAVAVMEQGARRCRPVATAEFFDSLGNWTEPSLLSLGVSELARDCVTDAMAAAARLRAALPEQSLSVDLDGLDDVIRRLIDYLHQPVFRRLSHGHAAHLSTGQPMPDMSDINKHGQVAEKLEIMARMLTPLSIHLAQLADRADRHIADHSRQAEPLLAPYRQAAHAELPAPLQQLLMDA